MASPRLVFLLSSVVTLTFFLTFISLLKSHPQRHAATESIDHVHKGVFHSLFSFRSPSALFPSSAIISLMDDNSTFFLSRPADFGPTLPGDGLSGQLWVGSGFGDDNLGRGLATDAEGELGCSDVPGWRDDNRHHQDEGQFEPSAPRNPTEQYEAIRTSATKPDVRQRGDLDTGIQRSRPIRYNEAPSKEDGTDDHLHHPLPASHFSRPSIPGQAVQLEADSSSHSLQHADIQSLQESAEIAGKLVLLSRGGCGFLEKVKWVQRRGGAALIVGDNTRGGPLITMYARGDTSNVTIPALFTSRTTAHLLSSLIPPETISEEYLPSDDFDTLKSTGEVPHRPTTVNVEHSGPTFTPTRAGSRPTSAFSPRLRSGQAKSSIGKGSSQKNGRSNWFLALFRSNSAPTSLSVGESEDSRRPPSSGRLTWVNEQWTEKAANAANEQMRVSNDGKTHNSDSSQKGTQKPGSHSSLGDSFEIGIQDWRDPDLVGGKAANSATVSSATTVSKAPTPATTKNPGKSGSGDEKGLSGGSITPGSGEYHQVSHANKASANIQELESATLDSNDKGDEPQRWLGHAVWRDNTGNSHSKTAGSHVIHGASPKESGATEDHNGLWVTLTPTTMSTSPFFDTLLVLVISPLVTLTVVYALLLIRSRIRRRRWRAPKSVVDRLPIRTYHTMSCSSTTSSSQIASPRTSSPASPLLVSSSRSVVSRSRPRSHTASGIGDAIIESLDNADTKAALKRQGVPASKGYRGKQIECVVCLEEYVDGCSKVMRLPCGHEFHAECM